MATDVIGLEALIQREPDRASLRDDIAVLYMELNRPADAVPHFEAALKLKPGSAAAHFNYGTALAGAGRFEEAIVAVRARACAAAGLRHRAEQPRNRASSTGTAATRARRVPRSARIDPQLAEAHLNVGLVSRALRDFPEAVTRFRRALELNPDWVTALASLASVHAAAPDASVRNPTEAVRLAERAVMLTLRRDANTLDVLSVAYASAGEFDRAVVIADEALALDPPAPLAAIIRTHQELFRSHRPYVSAR